jgi:hypothetical protein
MTVEISTRKRRCGREEFWLHAKSPTHALTTNPVIGHFSWNADL